VSDIDPERLLLRIEQGKGRKDRFAMLSPRLLDLLRDWYRIARPTPDIGRTEIPQRSSLLSADRPPEPCERLD
jgi:integrase